MNPTSGLDPIGCRDVKNLICLLSGRNKTIIISSHLLADLEEICDRVFVLHKGKIHAQGRLTTLLTIPNKIRITLSSSNSKVIDKIMELCKTSDPPEEVIVDQPAIRLEDFFLRTVSEAVTPTCINHSEVNSQNHFADFLLHDAQGLKSSEQLLKKRNLEYTGFNQNENNANPLPESNLSPSTPDLAHLKSLSKEKAIKRKNT